MVSEFDALGFTHFILLDRRNRLRKIISSIIAHQAGIYHIKHTDRSSLRTVHVDVENVQIDFDSKPLIDHLSGYDDGMQAITEKLAGRKVLSLTYEEDIQDDPGAAYRRVCDFLGVKPEAVAVDLARTNPFRLCDMVQNWDDVERILVETKYKWMLYD